MACRTKGAHCHTAEAQLCNNLGEKDEEALLVEVSYAVAQGQARQKKGPVLFYARLDDRYCGRQLFTSRPGPSPLGTYLYGHDVDRVVGETTEVPRRLDWLNVTMVIGGPGSD